MHASADKPSHKFPRSYHEQFRELHRQLAYRPERTKLSVTATAGERELLVSVNDAPPIGLPAHCEPDFARTLAHYPVPVAVNGVPVRRTPYEPKAGVLRTWYEGDLQDAREQTERSADYVPGGSVLLDGVRYSLGNSLDLGPDHQLHSITTYLAPDPQDGQPHFDRASAYIVRPNYRWDTAGDDLADFHFGHENPYISCRLPGQVYSKLQPQRRQQEADALRTITERSGGGPVTRFITEQYTSRITTRLQSQWLGHGANPARLLVHGEPATFDPGLGSPLSPTTNCLARGLYQRPEHNLAPVLKPTDKRRPSIACERIAVVDKDGREAVWIYDPTQKLHAPEAEAIPYDHVTGAQAITAYLAVTYPDGAVRQVELPLDLFCTGEMYEEVVLLTTAWGPERHGELQDLLYRYYYRDGEKYADPEQDQYEYRQEAGILATGLLFGEAAAVQADLQRVCDDFYSQWKAGSVKALSAGNDRQRLILLPRPNPMDAAPDDTAGTGLYRLSLSPRQFAEAQALLHAIGITLDAAAPAPQPPTA